MTTIRFAILCAACVTYFLATPASAATSLDVGIAEIWPVAAIVIAGLCASILVVVVLLWRRRAKAAAEAIAAARERSLKRHTKRMATEFAEPNF